MTVLRKIRNQRRVLSQEGVGGVVRALPKKIVNVSEFVVLRRDLRGSSPEVHCELSFELRRIDDATLTTFKDLPAPFPRHYQYRFLYGQRNCYGAMLDGKIGALFWPSFAADNERVVNRWRYLLPDEARIGSIWADCRFRGTGLMDVCLERFFQYFAETGYRYVYAFTWIGNKSARKLHGRLGFENVGKVWNIRFAWRPAGSGIYIRPAIPREPISEQSPGADTRLPHKLL